MHFTALQGSNLRCFAEFSLTPILGVNLLLGENGAGKTSVLEALYLLGYGRSFRGRVRDGLIQQGHRQLLLRAHWLNSHGGAQHGGLQHSGSDWQARLNGEAVDNLGQFCSQFPVLCFEPGSHELISGAAEHRRRFIDWALFHVEPDFYLQWRRFSRALKQRNALLKSNPSANALLPWDREFAEAGESISAYRNGYLNQLLPYFKTLCQSLLPESQQTELLYSAGWRDGLPLLDALRLSRERDVQTGFCSVGPHRADWKTRMDTHYAPEHFSRGQAKLLALAAVLAQAQHFQAHKTEWPVLCFDDLASELDARHLGFVLSHLAETKAQVWITGTQGLPHNSHPGMAYKQFHVEQASIREAD
jgi:DNA replication and repair protein RecF